ncbi:MAG: 2-hydroxymuconic semialdehyde dehydrogenase [Betaproteobacteria bacterium]|nr:MAG: 2-hydroxymuconic semialdehyde dehydrogenase [Betaproteobacteria bacterium]
MKLIRNFVNGEFVTTHGARFAKVSPVTGEIVAEIESADEALVNSAVSAASAALSGQWSRFSVSQRTALLQAIAAEIGRKSKEFIDAEIADTGKPYALASTLDVPRGAANFLAFSDLMQRTPQETWTTETPDGRGAINTVTYAPKGVIAVICPWNLPLLLMTWKVAPALACGNTVVVKPSEESPGTATLLAEVMNAVGVPPGVYNVVHGHGPKATGEFLTQHPGVHAITFTGESKTGEAIMKNAAKGLRDVSFELGGKNAGIVFADCDFDAAVEGIARATFLNCGQVCLGTERVYVERPIFERFVTALAAKARSLKPGDPYASDTTIGPLISREHREKVLSYFAKATADGATCHAGGGIPSLPENYANGAWIEPTVWTGLPETSAVIREEIFGPCCHVAPFDSEEEAITRANDSPYGLATSIWTQDVSRANRVARRIRVGIAWVNSWFLRDLRTPFGGAGISGIGREGGSHSLAFYTEMRNVCVKL